MSNALAIATVTATLRRTLQSAVDQDLAGATVITLRPGAESNGTPTRGVAIYLYQVLPNAAWRNQDLPTRRFDGSLSCRPRAALNLHYLLAFYGDDNELEPQRLLGTAVRTMHTYPVLTSQMIRDTVMNPTFTFLAGSDLAEDVELVKFSPLPMSLEELSKLWSVFFQIPYSLSIAYQGTVVLIDADEVPQPVLPVQDRNVYVIPLRHPTITAIRSDAGPAAPIVAGSNLVIIGTQFKSDITKVRIGENLVSPTSISDTEIRLAITATLPAGITGVQVVQQISMGDPATIHGGVDSNLAAFVLRPTIASVQVQSGGGVTNVVVQVNPPVVSTQRVVLMLNSVNLAGTGAKAYRFEHAAANPSDPTGTSRSGSVGIPIANVAPGQYIVRVQIDGAESPVTFDASGANAVNVVQVP